MKTIRTVPLLTAAFLSFAVCSPRPSTRAAVRSQDPQANSASNDHAGGKPYADNCAICHGDHREGNLPAFPPLLGIEHHMTDAQITAIIVQGKDRMPPFPNLQGEELKALITYLHSPSEAQSKTVAANDPNEAAHALVESGGALFQQNCAFCHGRDAMGGETGPDLTQSKIVKADVNGDKIAEVVRDGRPAQKMPAFNFSPPEMQGLVAFIHSQTARATLSKGGRRGVAVEDLQTGNVEAGKLYFSGNCAQCHSPTGDLAGVASRYQGLALERRMLYPRDAQSKVTVTLPNGKQIAGVLDYLDEFHLGMRDDSGTYHSWPLGRIHYKVSSPADAHVELFPKYSDADIHNLMAYLQTLH